MFFFADICIIRAEYSKVNQKMNKCSLLSGRFSYIMMLNEILTSAFTTINWKFLLHSEKIKMVIQYCGKVGQGYRGYRGYISIRKYGGDIESVPGKQTGGCRIRTDVTAP
jgi:hypothetical protein